MSKLRNEIKLSMSQLRSDGQELTAHFCFSSEFIGFKGHFPSRPVLPGVCKIQAILCMLEEAARKTPHLKEIVSAKFFTPVTGNEEIVCTVRQESEGSEETRVLALVTKGKIKIAEIKLRVSFRERGGADAQA
jgi:3-hydroxymyristoyl/3-hydroxydecanoyl-(acyl carrier protein) dehydratase